MVYMKKKYYLCGATINTDSFHRVNSVKLHLEIQTIT